MASEKARKRTKGTSPRNTKPSDRSPSDASDGARFDADYYARFYGAEETRVAGQAETARLVRFVAGYLDYLQLPVHRVLDMGCGIGLWQAPVAEAFPEASYTGVEVSAYLCETHGFQRGSADTYRGRGLFDLVVCQGVLQYLDDARAEAAIDNLCRLCRGALYLEALTREDWAEHVDQERTDGDVHKRLASWYRRRLAADFIAIGGGLFLKKTAPVTLFSLERP